MYNLVLSGGGIKGLMHLGALKSLEENNILKNIKNFAGSSAGSIIVLLLCVGFTYNDIMVIFFKINTDKLYDISDIFEFLNIYGLINLDPLEKLLRILLEIKFKKKHITFSELYNLTGKNLNINCININTTNETIFNYINSPNIDIIDACIASSSLPFIFSPKIINNEYYIDAFSVNNCPCNIFKNDLENTICLNIAKEKENINISSLQNYIMNVFNSIRNYSQNVKLYKPKIMISLFYNCSPIDIDLPKNILSDMCIIGYNTTNIYFKNNPIQKNNIKKEDAVNEEDDANNEKNDTVNEKKDAVNEEEDAVNEKEDADNEKDDTVNEEEDANNEEDGTVNEEEDVNNEDDDTVKEVDKIKK